MSKSVLYSGNSASLTTVASGSVIPFNDVVKKYGCNLSISGGNVVTNGIGYYNGIVNLTFEGTASGTANIIVFEDGVEIPYASASVTTADATIYSVSVPFETRNKCCCDKTITVIVSGAIVTVTNASIIVSKE